MEEDISTWSSPHLTLCFVLGLIVLHFVNLIFPAKLLLMLIEVVMQCLDSVYQQLEMIESNSDTMSGSISMKISLTDVQKKEKNMCACVQKKKCITCNSISTAVKCSFRKIKLDQIRIKLILSCLDGPTDLQLDWLCFSWSAGKGGKGGGGGGGGGEGGVSS